MTAGQRGNYRANEIEDWECFGSKLKSQQMTTKTQLRQFPDNLNEKEKATGITPVAFVFANPVKTRVS